MLDTEVKSNLRRHMLSERNAISLEAVSAGSHGMIQQLLSWPLFQQAKTIMGYLAMPGEPQLDCLLAQAIKAGKTVCVPLMGSVYGVMESAKITNIDDIIIGRLGVRMPNPSRTRIIDPECIDCVLTPGVAFDYHGNRMGMGAGYYDRFFVRAPQALRVGICWSWQVMPSIPYEAHDICMHWLVTEGNLICCDDTASPQQL